MCAACTTNGDVVFVLDASGSIEERNFNMMKSFVSSIVSDMDMENDRTRVGVLAFSNNAELQFHLNKYRHVQMGIYYVCLCGTLDKPIVSLSSSHL